VFLDLNICQEDTLLCRDSSLPPIFQSTARGFGRVGWKKKGRRGGEKVKREIEESPRIFWHPEEKKNGKNV